MKYKKQIISDKNARLLVENSNYVGMLRDNFIFKHFPNNNYMVRESYSYANYSHLTQHMQPLSPDTIISFVYQYFFREIKKKTSTNIIIYAIQFGALNAPNIFRSLNMPFDVLCSLLIFCITFKTSVSVCRATHQRQLK